MEDSFRVDEHDGRESPFQCWGTRLELLKINCFFYPSIIGITLEKPIVYIDVSCIFFLHNCNIFAPSWSSMTWDVPCNVPRRFVPSFRTLSSLPFSSSTSCSPYANQISRIPSSLRRHFRPNPRTSTILCLLSFSLISLCFIHLRSPSSTPSANLFLLLLFLCLFTPPPSEHIIPATRPIPLVVILSRAHSFGFKIEERERASNYAMAGSLMGRWLWLEFLRKWQSK